MWWCIFWWCVLSFPLSISGSYGNFIKDIQGTIKLCYKAAEPSYIPTIYVWSVKVLSIVTLICYMSFDYSSPSGCKTLFHWALACIFLMVNDVGLFFIFLLAILFSTLEKSFFTFHELSFDFLGGILSSTKILILILLFRPYFTGNFGVISNKPFPDPRSQKNQSNVFF